MDQLFVKLARSSSNKYLLSNIKNNEMNYDNRVTLYKLLHGVIHNEEDCGDLRNYELLNKGGFSTNWKKVLNFNGKVFSIALKVQFVKRSIFNDKFSLKYNVWMEYDVLIKCTELVISKISPNVPIVYDLQLCSPDKIIFYNELAKGSFIDWCYEDHTVDDWESFLFQLWCGLHVLQKYLDLVHNDLRFGNVLFHETRSTYKYVIDDKEYYLPTKYTFVIWDYGGAKKANDEIMKRKLYLNTDLHFFHDAYNRLRVLMLLNKYTSEELEKFFTTEEELEYVEHTREECEKRFRRTGRFDEKCRISFVYYLIEHGKFNEMYKNKKDNLSESKVVRMPPKSIMMLLKDLSDNYNYKYDDVITVNLGVDKIIPNPNELIHKYFKKYLEKREFDYEFIL